MSRSRSIETIALAVGNTPVVRLRNIERTHCPDAELWLKLEYQNPGGSVKDRAALAMMKSALADGRLTRDRVLIDATSGNTGVAYSMLGAALGVKIQLVIPSNVSQARKDIAMAYGTELVFSDPMEGSDGAIRLVRDLVAKEPERYFYPDQYSNPDNPGAHYHGTGVEIIGQLGSRLTHFIAGLGTSGTMMGTTRRLREYARESGRDIRCIALEPDDALHGLEGLKHMKSSLVPPIYDPQLPDETLFVRTEDGWDMADLVAREEGLHIGHSAGANVFGAARVAAQHGRACVVTIACDRGDRYFAPMRWEARDVY